MSAHHDRAQAALKSLLATLHSYRPHERNAVQAGWEYVMDQCSGSDGYDIKRMPTSGQEEAYDLANGTVEEKPWRPGERDKAADYIYTGIVAARKFVKGESNG